MSQGPPTYGSPSLSCVSPSLCKGNICTYCINKAAYEKTKLININNESKQIYSKPKPIYQEPKPVYQEPKPVYQAPTCSSSICSSSICSSSICSFTPLLTGQLITREKEQCAREYCPSHSYARQMYPSSQNIVTGLVLTSTGVYTKGYETYRVPVNLGPYYAQVSYPTIFSLR